jgi:hypothetical protein
MWPTDATTMDTHQMQNYDKVEESSPEALESPWKLASEPCDLPDSYGETRVVLLPVEPYLLHIYWEVTPVELQRAKDQLCDEHGQSQAILRCYDVTNIIFDGTNAHGSFDVCIDLLATSWYVHLWSPEKSYFVELGFRTKDGRFYPIARSNIAEIPPDWPAPKSDEHYMLVAGDYDLLETVPAPTDVQPSHEPRPPRASQPEPELLSAAERDCDFETRSPLAAEEDSSGAEVYEEPFGDDRTEAGKVNEPGEMGKAEPLSEVGGSIEQSSREKGRLKEACLDLTEMSEKRFVSGVSSNR